ncbi:nucleoporin protein Ndc1-Nup [Mucor mucedo]|uniref:nucleoporin protein Ndc1-Nup n=1 Tax=Mucor mucedo TaxID=29922 RepID=UPI002220E390|nr:nucleoporin protein Ndc1-Nup [Mucor mucedo]KAI7888681.1 nucleoporin protein Ndc1-Nup [Mucor mucedo]
MQSASLPKPAAAISKPLGKVNCASYESAYKSVVRRLTRQYFVTLYLFCGFFAILFQLGFFFNYHTFLNVLSLKTFFFSLLLFLIGGITFVVRLSNTTIWQPVYPSRLATVIVNCISLDNLFLFIIHAIGNLVVIRTYLYWMMSEKYTAGFLLNIPGHYTGARQLNEENIFICVYAIMLGFNYTVDYVKKRTHVLQALNVKQPAFYDIKTSLGTVLCNSAKRALYSFAMTYVTFIFFHVFFYYSIARFFGLFTRVLSAPIIKFHWFDLHLFLRLTVGGILSTCVFNISNRVYEALFSLTLPCTNPYANQFECLIKGLEEKKDEQLKVSAFSELATLASKCPSKREELFKTTGNELQDNAWYKIMVQCFQVIQEFRSKIDIEYNGVQPVVAPITVTKPVEKNIRHRLEFSNGNVFSTPKKNQVYYDDRTGSLLSPLSELAQEGPSGETVISKPLQWIRQSDMVDMLKRLEVRFGRAGMFEPFYAETVTRRVQGVFNKYQLLLWAVQALGCLTAGSLKEDPYGYVQNDIGNVLNHLLGCLMEVERYVQSPPAHYSQLLNEKVLSGETEAVMMALREAIYQIKEAFGNYTDGFQVDGKYSKKWQGFLNYQE